MTHELILTSVAQGLDPNDCGFCPVAVDSAISPRIYQHLLTLNGYRHLVATSAVSPRLSPVAYSHLILPGEIEHVLSRVADAGTDYQNQPNVLAHHIVLDGMDASPEGPAWLLALPGFHFAEWKGLPLRFTHGRPIPTLTIPPSLTRRQQIARQHHWLDPQKMALSGSVDTESEAYRAAVRSNDEQAALAAPPTTPCPVWKELAGDPGWGGVLAETAFTGQPVILIYNPDQNILPLYVEALALLPSPSSWRVTFCTYFTGLPDTIYCQWRGVLAGSNEAKQLAADLNNLVFDLTAPMGEPLAGKYVDFARHGQEYMLPLEAEEHAASLANADTKPYDDTNPDTDKLNPPPPSPPPTEPALPPVQTIRMPRKRVGLSELFLRKTSRFQFYFLYCVMFILVLVLLVLAIDSRFGIIQMLQHWNRVSILAPDEPAPAIESKLDADAELEQGAKAESELEQIVPEIVAEPEDARKTFEERKEKQKLPLLQFWKSFDVPEFLTINFPDVQNNQIDVPEKTTFAELKSLQPYGSALELRFIPLFELPTMTVETSLDVDALPHLIWMVNAIDSETHEGTPMFLFQLTESGFEMDWQLEGLNNQYLYDTILSSLGFLQLNVTDVPETATLIPLFAPVTAEVMEVSDLAGLVEMETSEYIVDLPFASELWQRIFAEMKPPKTLRLEVRVEPKGDWLRIEPSSVSEFHAEIRTSQQAGKPTESGETVFEKITVPFVATASLEKIVWKGGECAERLHSERENIKKFTAGLEKKIEQLKAKIFDGKGDAADRNERETCEAELKRCDSRLKEIESILGKLPDAYKEIGQNESARFHYEVFLEAETGNKRLRILTTVSRTPDGF